MTIEEVALARRPGLIRPGRSSTPSPSSALSLTGRAEAGWPGVADRLGRRVGRGIIQVTVRLHSDGWQPTRRFRDCGPPSRRSATRCALSWPSSGYGAKGLDYDPNFADSSQVTAERGENEALVNKLVEGLRDVEHALGKFDSDSYGVCESCGQPIAAARLEARPEARLCIDCAAAAADRR